MSCSHISGAGLAAVLLAGLASGTPAPAADAAAVPSAAAPHYRLSRTVPLGPPDRWDYLTFDPLAHRLYISHGDRVTVVDGHDGSLLGEVTGFPGGTHGIVVLDALGQGYTDDGRAGEAGTFDLKTLQAGRRIKAEEDADGMTYDAVSGHVFVVNGDSATLTAIDPKSGAAVATIAAGGKLEFAVSGNNGKLYVNGAGKGEIVRVDTRTNQADAHWPMPGCTSPHGLAIDTLTHRLFSSCVNGVLKVVDADSGAILATLPIGAGTDAAAFDPKRHLVFSSNGRDGTLSIILEKDAQTFVDLGSMPTAPMARTMAIDPDTGRLFLVSARIDAAATTAAGNPAPRRPAIVPGSLQLLFLDPEP